MIYGHKNFPKILFIHYKRYKLWFAYKNIFKNPKNRLYSLLILPCVMGDVCFVKDISQQPRMIHFTQNISHTTPFGKNQPYVETGPSCRLLFVSCALEPASMSMSYVIDT